MRSSALRHAATRANHVHAFRDRLIWLRCAVCPPTPFRRKPQHLRRAYLAGAGAGRRLSFPFFLHPGGRARGRRERDPPQPRASQEAVSAAALCACAPRGKRASQQATTLASRRDSVPILRARAGDDDAVACATGVGDTASGATWPDPDPGKPIPDHSLLVVEAVARAAPRRTLPFLAASSPLLLRSAYKYLPSTRHRFS